MEICTLTVIAIISTLRVRTYQSCSWRSESKLQSTSHADYGHCSRRCEEDNAEEEEVIDCPPGKANG